MIDEPKDKDADVEETPVAEIPAAESPTEAEAPAEEPAVVQEPVADAPQPDPTPTDEPAEQPAAAKADAPAKAKAEGDAPAKAKAKGDAPAKAKAKGDAPAKAKADAPAKAKPDVPARAPKPARRGRRDADGVTVVRAQAKYVRTSARKARMVCDQIRGKGVEEAYAILAHTPRAVAQDWEKLLKSAVANAENNHELLEDDLKIVAVFADEGPTLKRFRPRAMGRATPIRKRTSHLTIQLTPKD